MSAKDTLQEIEGAIKPVLEGFKELQEKVSKTDKETKDAMEKFDGLDVEKFNKVSKSVDELLEKQTKLDGELKAEKEAKEKLEIAFERLSLGSESPEKKMAEIQEKRNAHFNNWAKKRSDNKESFDSFLDRVVEDEGERKSLSVDVDANGGYLVMPEFGGVIQTRIYESSPLRQLATVENVSTDQYELILDDGEAAAGWVGESQARPETNTPTLGKLIIPVHEMYANPKSTQKMLDDGIVDVEAWLANKVADIFARTEATAFISGDGVLKPKGLLSYDAGTTLASQQIQQVNSGSTSTFTYDGLVALQNALKEAYQPGAAFMLQRASNTNIMTIKDGESRPIFNMTYDKNVGLTPTIMGKPAYFGADMPAVATNALAAAYGDFRQAYRVLDRTGIRVLRDPFTSKPNVCFYTTKRVGGAVVNFEAVKIQKIAS